MDSHVGKHIFENILDSQTGLLRGKTRLLVTNNLSILPRTDAILVVDNGRIIEQGSYNQLMKANGHLARLVQQYVTNHEEDKDDEQNEETSEERKAKVNERIDNTNEKLVEKEKVQHGRVTWSVYFRYLKSITFSWAFIFSLGYVLSNASSAFSAAWLSEWSRVAESNSSGSNLVYLALYGLIGSGQGLFASFGYYAMTKGTLKAALRLHHNMLVTILRSPMAFFDVTPLGRILNRFSKDIEVCDSTVQDNIR